MTSDKSQVEELKWIGIVGTRSDRDEKRETKGGNWGNEKMENGES